MPHGKMNPLLALSEQHGALESAKPEEVDRLVQQNQRSSGSAPSNDSPITPEIKRLMEEFPDPKTALLAASWGEDRTRQWMEDGGNMSEVPEEDLQFVQDMLPKVREGMNKPVESTTISQTPEREGQQTAEKARRRAREDILANTVANGAERRGAAREAAQGLMNEVQSAQAEQVLQSPEVSRRAPQ